MSDTTPDPETPAELTARITTLIDEAPFDGGTIRLDVADVRGLLYAAQAAQESGWNDGWSQAQDYFAGDWSEDYEVRSQLQDTLAGATLHWWASAEGGGRIQDPCSACGEGPADGESGVGFILRHIREVLAASSVGRRADLPARFRPDTSPLPAVLARAGAHEAATDLTA